MGVGTCMSCVHMFWVGWKGSGGEKESCGGGGVGTLVGGRMGNVQVVVCVVVVHAYMYTCAA